MKSPRTGGNTFPRYDVLAEYPRAALLPALAVLAALIAILHAANGADGPLGQSLPLFFLVPVLVASALGGLGAGVLISVVSVFAWDWFFITPRYRVTVASSRDALALLVFVLVALLVGQLSTLARRRTGEAVRRALASEAVYDLSVGLIARQSPSDLLTPLLERLSAVFDLAACAVLLPDRAGGWDTTASAGILPRELRTTHSRNVAAIVNEVFSLGREYRLGGGDRANLQRGWIRRPHRGPARARFIPLRVGDRTVGVLEFVPRDGERLDLEREHLLSTFANSAAIAIEQVRLTQEEQAAAIARESDRLKTALLSSVSHDLRTPLAGIKAAASSLLQSDVTWSEEDRRAFITDIDTEADRLTRFVSNLLDLSRIEAGAIRPVKDWEDLSALIDRVLRRMEPRLRTHTIERDIAPGLPPVQIDVVQIEQVLANLLENAAKYTPEGTLIRVSASALPSDNRGSRIALVVHDDGPGIAVRDQARVFDTFYRGTGVAPRVPGTGMGLAIVKGLVEAHGGRVYLESTVGKGTSFIVELPIDDPAVAITVPASAIGAAAGPASVA